MNSCKIDVNFASNMYHTELFVVNRWACHRYKHGPQLLITWHWIYWLLIKRPKYLQPTCTDLGTSACCFVNCKGKWIWDSHRWNVSPIISSLCRCNWHLEVHAMPIEAGFHDLDLRFHGSKHSSSGFTLALTFSVSIVAISSNNRHNCYS